jgi:hypothetical protein
MNLDDHPIRSIGWQPTEFMPGEYSVVEVGEEGVTAIDVMEQYCGDYSIYWFQVWRNDQILARYNARNIDSVHYFEEDE